MEKNVIVTDSEGNVVGSTYGKRAKGLVKSGRAKFIGDCEIRLLNEDDPSAFRHMITEAKIMGNVIEFQAGEFGLVKSCDTNCGSKIIVTIGEENIRCYEIGNREGDRTKIEATKRVEPNTDYVFRFAIRVAPGIWDDATSLVSICPGENTEDELIFPMDRADQNRFKPSICKRFGDEILRVYEIPFHTDSYDTVKILIDVEGMRAWIQPAKELADYAGMPDVSYDQWRSEEGHRWTAKITDFGKNAYDGVTDLGGQLGETLGELGSRLTRTVTGAVTGAVNKASETAEKFRSERAAKAAQAQAEEGAKAAQDAAQKVVDFAGEAAETVAGVAKEAVDIVVSEFRSKEEGSEETASGTDPDTDKKE